MTEGRQFPNFEPFFGPDNNKLIPRIFRDLSTSKFKSIYDTPSIAFALTIGLPQFQVFFEDKMEEAGTITAVTPRDISLFVAQPPMFKPPEAIPPFVTLGRGRQGTLSGLSVTGLMSWNDELGRFLTEPLGFPVDVGFFRDGQAAVMPYDALQALDGGFIMDNAYFTIKPELLTDNRPSPDEGKIMGLNEFAFLMRLMRLAVLGGLFVFRKPPESNA